MPSGSPSPPRPGRRSGRPRPPRRRARRSRGPARNSKRPGGATGAITMSMAFASQPSNSSSLAVGGAQGAGAPERQLAHGRPQLAAVVGQLVDLRRRRRRQGTPGDDAVAPRGHGGARRGCWSRCRAGGRRGRCSAWARASARGSRAAPSGLRPGRAHAPSDSTARSACAMPKAYHSITISEENTCKNEVDAATVAGMTSEMQVTRAGVDPTAAGGWLSRSCAWSSSWSSSTSRS